MKMLKNMFRAFLYFSANSKYEMKPHQTFLFFVVIILFAFFFENRWRVQPFFVGDLTHVSENEIYELDSVIVVDTQNFSVETLFETADPLIRIEPVSYRKTNTIASYIGLENFFELLKTSADTLVRVIYYADSQIEGDRITHPLRKAFQQRFGGKGIGYMPAEMYFNTTEQLAIITNDFMSDVVHYKSDYEKIDYGLYGRFFTPTTTKAQIRVNNRSKTDCFSKMKILYSGKAKMLVENENVQCTELLADKASVEMLSFEKIPATIRLNFTDHEDFKLYGFLFDPEKGIAIDHVPFRGNANLMMNRFESESIIDMGKMLKPSLVVLHFGLNVVPDIRDNYHSYQLALERDVRLLKEYLPGVSVLIIGVSDMARRVDGQMQSYPNIDAIVQAQRIAANNSDAHFFDLRERMGGEGAIIDWVEKGWAKSDYAHFTLEGSEKAGQWIADYLLELYNQYLSQND